MATTRKRGMADEPTGRPQQQQHEGKGKRKHEEEKEEGDEEEEQGRRRKAREGLDYDTLAEEDARWVRDQWARTLGRLGTSASSSSSVRVEVEKSLSALLPRLVRHLLQPPHDDEEEEEEAEEGGEKKAGRPRHALDPAHHARVHHAVRVRELAEEEARLADQALRLQRELADLARANLHHRNHLRATTALAVPDPSLPSPPPARAREQQRHEGHEEEEGAEGGGASVADLREEIDAAFARFIEEATRLADDAAGDEREGKLARMLAVWRRKANADQAVHAGANTEQDADEATRAKLIAAFRS